MGNWTYYNKAMVPVCEPHENVNLDELNSGAIWNHPKKPLIARWTGEYDNVEHQNWWYCIKDEVLDLSKLKKKRRYEIIKGLKNNEIIIVDPCLYTNEIFLVMSECYETYPKKYRPFASLDTVSKQCLIWKKENVTFVAIDKETGAINGFVSAKPYNTYVNLEILKVPIRNRNKNVNEALIFTVLDEMLERRKYDYISDGQRNIVHETNFMNYLVKQFGFRYVYCNLYITYNPKIKLILKVLYPMRRVVKLFSFNKYIYNVYSILRMEEISRKSR